MGKAGLWTKHAFAKTWSKALVSRRLTDTVRMEFSQLVFDFSHRDLHVADGNVEKLWLWEREVSSQDCVNFWASGPCM